MGKLRRSSGPNAGSAVRMSAATCASSSTTTTSASPRDKAKAYLEELCGEELWNEDEKEDDGSKREYTKKDKKFWAMKSQRRMRWAVMTILIEE